MLRYSFLGYFASALSHYRIIIIATSSPSTSFQNPTVSVNVAKWTWSKWILMSGVKVNNWRRSQQPKWFFIVDHANICIKMSSRIYISNTNTHHVRTRITINRQPSMSQRTNIGGCLFVCLLFPFFSLMKKNHSNWYNLNNFWCKAKHVKSKAYACH